MIFEVNDNARDENGDVCFEWTIRISKDEIEKAGAAGPLDGIETLLLRKFGSSGSIADNILGLSFFLSRLEKVARLEDR